MLIFAIQNTAYISHITHYNCLHMTLFKSFMYFDTLEKIKNEQTENWNDLSEVTKPGNGNRVNVF